MQTFNYRVCGRDRIEIAAHPRTPKGPWLELDAESHADARRILAETSAATGYVYELRAPDAEEG